MSVLLHDLLYTWGWFIIVFTMFMYKLGNLKIRGYVVLNALVKDHVIVSKQFFDTGYKSMED
jgi:hypothetical protein